MTKSHNKCNTLNLQFSEELSPIQKEMLIIYQENIVALYLDLNGSEDFLIDQSMTFCVLECLSVNLYDVGEPIKQKNITESLIVKFASKLKKLSVMDYENIIDELTIPALHNLESLSVHGLKPEPAWSLFTASRQTIKSLDMGNVLLPINNADMYEVPNLQNLTISKKNSKYLSPNAKNLVSLTLNHLMGYDLPSGGIPELPKLRELNMYHYVGRHYPIFSMCKDLLKCLVLHHSSLDGYDVATMHQLTDLYIVGNRISGSWRYSKFLSYNHKSLEFLFLKNVCPQMITLDDGVKLYRVETVVIRSDGERYNVYIKEVMSRVAEMCPNARILITDEKNMNEMREYVISRHRRRGFTTDIQNFFPSDWV